MNHQDLSSMSAAELVALCEGYSEEAYEQAKKIKNSKKAGARDKIQALVESLTGEPTSDPMDMGEAEAPGFTAEQASELEMAQGMHKAGSGLGYQVQSWIGNYHFSYEKDENLGCVVAFPSVTSHVNSGSARWCWLAFGSEVRLKVEQGSDLDFALGLTWADYESDRPVRVKRSAFAVRGRVDFLKSGHITLQGAEVLNQNEDQEASDLASEVYQGWHNSIYGY
jgi:hypothetical protein